jgi:hypothetical protein
MSMKNSSDTIGNRACDLPASSTVPQPNALPAVCPQFLICYFYYPILLQEFFSTHKYSDIKIMYQNSISIFGFGVKKEGKYIKTFIFRIVPVDKLQMITHENIYDLAVVKEGEVRLSGNL